MIRAVNLSFFGAFSALVLSAIAMALSPVFVRIASAEVGPFASAFWRVFLSLPFLYIWFFLETRSPKAPVKQDITARRKISLYAFYAGLAFTGDLFCWHLAILNTSIANATFLATMTPVFILLFLWILFHQKPASRSVWGVLVCIAGGAVLTGIFAGQFGNLTGDLYGIATAFFFSSYFLFVQQARPFCGAGQITFRLSLVTAFCLFLIAVADYHIRGNAIMPTTIHGASALLGMAFICHAAGQGLLAVALGRLPPVFSSLVIFVEAISAAIFGYIFVSETLSIYQIIGGLLILCGIWIARPAH